MLLAEGGPRRLIAPLKFHDGEHFPEEAKSVQCTDVSAYNITLPGFTVFTNDLDFGTLLASRKVRHPSVIQASCQEVMLASIGMIVVLTLQEHESYIEAGALVTVDLVKSRVRILPM